MFETIIKTKTSPRKDDGTIYIVANMDKSIGVYYRAIVRWLLGVKLNSPLYGEHVTIVSGKHEKIKKEHNFIENAELRVGYDQRIYNYGPRYILPIYDIHGDLGDFRESLGLPRDRNGIRWHSTIGYNK